MNIKSVLVQMITGDKLQCGLVSDTCFVLTSCFPDVFLVLFNVIVSVK